ncbi:hypothetical protein N177_2952 [Lutibaculum baratangense AMV1]|uniref:Uncharacterized protein n=1 Tax=Lutibaculum baratangense AMV1 TaxID=631454 RepID=V4QVC6_9HYPH|nr:hypothetical protein N177_2952 [Lutibaculum baratangense AMV1]
MLPLRQRGDDGMVANHWAEWVRDPVASRALGRGRAMVRAR